MSESQQKKPDLGLLEEDDEFEEFPAEGPLGVGDSINLYSALLLTVCFVMVHHRHAACHCV